MYEKYRELRDRLGLRDSDVANGTGIGNSTFSDWKNGRSAPKREKLQKIAAFMGVNLSYFTGEDDPPYYISDDAKDFAEFLFNNPEYRVLFDASRKVKKENIAFVKEMIDRLS